MHVRQLSGRFLRNAALECDDGIGCTVDLCDANGVCQFVPSSALCDDGVVCTSDVCDPDNGCINVPDDDSCEDGNLCTTDTCDALTGCQTATVTCPSDQNPCTDDICLPDQGCVHPVNTAMCDDGNACTTADVCDNGTCVGGPPPDCDDGDACTNDTCVPAVGCVRTPACVDGNPCTLDLCLGPLLGCANPPIGCPDDGDLCTAEVCDSSSNGCISVPVDCDDDDPCTRDVCQFGACDNTPIECPPGMHCDEDTGDCACPALCGDLDDDGDVDRDDFRILRMAFGRSAGQSRFVTCADFDGDEVITLKDFREWMDCRRRAR